MCSVSLALFGHHSFYSSRNKCDSGTTFFFPPWEPVLCHSKQEKLVPNSELALELPRWKRGNSVLLSRKKLHLWMGFSGDKWEATSRKCCTVLQSVNVQGQFCNLNCCCCKKKRKKLKRFSLNSCVVLVHSSMFLWFHYFFNCIIASSCFLAESCYPLHSNECKKFCELMNCYTSVFVFFPLVSPNP